MTSTCDAIITRHPTLPFWVVTLNDVILSAHRDFDDAAGQVDTLERIKHTDWSRDPIYCPDCGRLGYYTDDGDDPCCYRCRLDRDERDIDAFVEANC